MLPQDIQSHIRDKQVGRTAIRSISKRLHAMKPSEDWIEDCVRHYGRVLKGEKAHWCPEWDYLPIDDTCPEIECCTCNLKQKK
jgi:hypothetical protein